MIDTVFIVLDVTVQHRCIRFESKFVRETCGVQPFVAVNLVIANDGANARGEDFCAATRHGIDSGFTHLYQRVFNGEFGPPGEIRNLDHREGLDMYLGKALLEPANEVQKILEWKIGMKSADNVELRYGLAVARGGRLPSLFKGHRVTGRITFLASECA